MSPRSSRLSAQLATRFVWLTAQARSAPRVVARTVRSVSPVSRRACASTLTNPNQAAPPTHAKSNTQRKPLLALIWQTRHPPNSPNGPVQPCPGRLSAVSGHRTTTRRPGEPPRHEFSGRPADNLFDGLATAPPGIGSRGRDPRRRLGPPGSAAARPPGALRATDGLPARPGHPRLQRRRSSGPRPAGTRRRPSRRAQVQGAPRAGSAPRAARATSCWSPTSPPASRRAASSPTVRSSRSRRTRPSTT